VLDVSIEKRGDFDYFNQLGKYVNSDEVALAFYRYCNEYVDDEFDPRDIPETNSKNELIIDNLINVLVCIKELFLLRKKDLVCKYSDFYKLYVEWCSSRHEKTKSKIEVARILNEHYIPTKNGTGNIKYCEIKYDELLKLYKAQHWIHHTDEYIEDDDENFDFDSLDIKVENKPSVSSIEIQTDEVKKSVDAETQTDSIDEKITKVNEMISINDPRETKADLKADPKADLKADPKADEILFSLKQKEEIIIKPEVIDEVVKELIIPRPIIDFSANTLIEDEEEVPIRRNKLPKSKPITIPKPVAVEHSEAEVQEALKKFHRMFSF
jgi:hypothetical protein